jgi:hypothetical protein
VPDAFQTSLAGKYDAFLSIYGSAIVTRPTPIPILTPTPTISPSVLLVSPPALNFGNAYMNGPLFEGNGIGVTLRAPRSRTLPSAAAGAIGRTRNITIRNNTAVTVQLGVAGSTPNFVITADGCANMALAPKTNCTVTVELAPPVDASGWLTNVLSYGFTYGANSGGVAITLKGKVNL